MRKPPKPWKANELAILRKNFVKASKDALVRMIPGKTWAEIEKTAHKMGLRKLPPRPGATFGKLKVLYLFKKVDRAHDRFTRQAAKCRCECGNMKDVWVWELQNGSVASCGCTKLIHGHSGDRLYQVFRGMWTRCYNPKHMFYSNYGGRGVRICDEWLEDFQKFWDWAYENGYKDDGSLTIDRIDSNGIYEPSNCRWATRTAQTNNRRTTQFLTAFGETKSVGDWTRDPRCQVSYSVLYRRTQLRGWAHERAITEAAN